MGIDTHNRAGKTILAFTAHLLVRRDCGGLLVRWPIGVVRCADVPLVGCLRYRLKGKAVVAGRSFTP